MRALLTTATDADWRVEYVPLLPLHSEQIHRYVAATLLRDRSIVVGGIGRAEYLATARELGLIEAIDRHAVIAQIAIWRDYAGHGQIIDLCMPVQVVVADPSAQRTGFAARHWRGCAADPGTRRRQRDGTGHAAAPIQQPEVARRQPGTQRQLRAVRPLAGTTLALPVNRLRVPAAALIDGMAGAQVMAQRWRASGRSLIADGVHSPALLSPLWALGVDHVAGDGIAVAAARPDFDFDAFAH